MTNVVEIDSPSVQSYVSILQSVINRMAANSAGCKTWCVALVSAIVVVGADKEKPGYVAIAVGPLALFLFLDSYYLGLETRFRERYNEFIQKLHSGTAGVEDLFIVTPGRGVGAFVKATGTAPCIAFRLAILRLACRDALGASNLAPRNQWHSNALICALWKTDRSGRAARPRSYNDR